MKRLLAALLLLAAANAAAGEKSVSLERDFGTLYGTLLTPGEGAETVAVIIAGSGPTPPQRQYEQLPLSGAGARKSGYRHAPLRQTGHRIEQIRRPGQNGRRHARRLHRRRRGLGRVPLPAGFPPHRADRPQRRGADRLLRGATMPRSRCRDFVGGRRLSARRNTPASAGRTTRPDAHGAADAGPCHHRRPETRRTGRVVSARTGAPLRTPRYRHSGSRR